jgi:hypothetical protein
MGFRKGQSGNPAGRPRGIEDSRTKHRGLFNARAEEIVNRAIEVALQGDVAALRLCVDRIAPPYRESESHIVVNTVGEAPSDLARKVVADMATGRLSPNVADTILTVVARQVKIIEADELAARITALENSSR